MAKFKLRGPDGGTYAITADTPEAAHAALYGGQTEAAPKVEQPPPQDNQKQTEDLPWYTKGAKALAFSAEQLMKGDAKTASYAGAKDLASHMYRNAQNAHEMGGLDNYDPASPHFSDSSKPWTERIGYAPRALLEGAAPMVQHGLGFIAGGPAGAAASVGASELGNTIDEVNAADKTDPNATPSPLQVARILGKVGADAGLTIAGGGATLGAKATLPKAAITDAIAGAGSVAADKGFVHGELPTPADLALNAGVGAATGAAIRLPSAAKEGMGQLHESIVDKRMKPLEDIDPTSLARAAKLVEDNQRGLEGAQEKLHLSLNEQRGHRDFTSQVRSIEETAAAKGQKDTIKEDLRLLHDDLSKGDTVSPDKIQNIASRVGGTFEGDRIVQTLTDMNTLNRMNKLDTGGLSATPIGMALNPYQRDRTSTPATRAGAALGRLAEGATIGHSLWSGKPSAMLAIAGQLGGSQILKGIDKLSGAADFESNLVKKYAGGDTGAKITSRPFRSPEIPRDILSAFRGQAKAAARIKKSAGETTVEHTPFDYHEAVVPGAFQDLVIRQPKSGIGKESGWKQGVANNIGFRTPALKAMADIASGSNNQKALAQLEMDWTHNTRTPEGGRSHFEDFLNESKLSEDQKQKLRDIYDSHEKELKTSWKKAK